MSSELKKYLDSRISKYKKYDEDEDKRKEEADRKIRKEELIYSLDKLRGSISDLGSVKHKPDKYYLDKAHQSKKDLETKRVGRQKDLLGLMDARRGVRKEEEASAQKKREHEFSREKFEYQKERDKKDRDSRKNLYDYKLKKDSKKPIPVDSEEKAIKKMMAEERSRALILHKNLDKLEASVKNKSLLQNLVGPEKPKRESLVYQIAIDFAKLVDPESVAREGEVESAKKYLLPLTSMMRQGTAQDLIDSYREDLKARRAARHQGLKETYKEKYTKHVPQKETEYHTDTDGNTYQIKYDEDGRRYYDKE